MVLPEDKVEEEAPMIHGDILEAVVSQVPLIDLAPASQVSKEWKRAVFSSLRHFNRIKPWLIVHTQSKRSPHATTMHAYDPRSHLWVEIRKPSIKCVSALPLRSSHSSILYTMTPSMLSFSAGSLNVTWQDLKGPLVWRADPIVAVVGHRVVVAGGTCDFEDDALAVEIYDLKALTWKRCESMPNFFKYCASATWLSVAASDHKMFVTEKVSGTTYTFDPSTENWQGPYDLHRADPCMFFSTVGFANKRLIMVGLVGELADHENVKSVKMWEVSGERLNCREIGEMPMPLVKKMIKGDDDDCHTHSIEMSCAGDMVYIYNPSDPAEIVLCELGGGDGGVCRWENVKNVVVNDTTRMGKFIVTSSMVEISDIQRAFRVENWKFTVKP